MSDERRRWRSQETPRRPRTAYRMGRPNSVKRRALGDASTGYRIENLPFLAVIGRDQDWGQSIP